MIKIGKYQVSWKKDANPTIIFIGGILIGAGIAALLIAFLVKA